ncbi:MAG: anthranilate phosphoribosyltransferase [Chrysiogenetes bacterium]|nr:anthranilate phosphoribosyltransferase [Chrysiogenetes bacterium]
MFKAMLGKIIHQSDLEESEVLEFLDAIVSGTISPAQTGAVLAALATKGPSSGEIAAVVRFLRRHLVAVSPKRTDLLDTCGTGGDASGTFNISTVVAFVAAGAGAAVAKHGNRAASSKSGSADVLEALGIRLDLSAEALADCIDEHGIGFLYAPAFHPAMKHVAPIRKELGIKTIFNLAGPLSNPAGATRQLVGVYDRHLTGPVAQALAGLGTERAMVVCGHDGLDEISLSAESEVAELKDGKVERWTLNPEDYGLPMCDLSALAGGTPMENAKIALDILDGKVGPQRTIVELNAGAALYVSGVADTLAAGIELAQGSIETGSARAKLEALRNL